MIKKIIEAKKISKYFYIEKKKKKIFKKINLIINSKESIGIIGESGVGKSTLLYLLAGLEKVSSGDIFFENKKISKFKDKEICYWRNNNIGFVYQYYYLIPELSILENIILPSLINKFNFKKFNLFGFLNFKKKLKKITEKCKYLLNKIGLFNKINYSINNLSGGEKQRIAIIRSVINNPKIIFADEPTGNLDIKNSEKIYKIFSELKKKKSTSIVTVTHDTKFIKSFDNLFELKKKKLKIIR